MTDRNYIDIDAALAEAGDEPIVVHVMGRDWTVPPGRPLKAMEVIGEMRGRRGGDAVADLETVFRLTRLIFGGDVFDKMLDAGLTDKHFELLIRHVLKLKAGVDVDAVVGEAEASTATTSPSSNTGQPSRPTSPASTIETSSPTSAPD